MTLTPAYGRDYKSKRAVEADLAAGKDFIVNDIMSPWDGKPANARSLREAGIVRVNVRYSQLRKVCVVRVP